MDIKEINSFMGKPIEYWVELDAYVKENMYDKLIEANVILKARIKELEERLETANKWLIRRGLRITELEEEIEEVRYGTLPYLFEAAHQLDTVLKKLVSK